MSNLVEYNREAEPVYAEFAAALRASEKYSEVAKQIAISISSKTKREQRQAIMKALKLAKESVGQIDRVASTYEAVNQFVKEQSKDLNSVSQKSILTMLDDLNSTISELLELGKAFEALSIDERFYNVKRLFFDEIPRRRTNVVMQDFESFKSEMVSNSLRIIEVGHETLNISNSLNTVMKKLKQGTLAYFDIEEYEEQFLADEATKRLEDESQELISFEEVKKTIGR